MAAEDDGYVMTSSLNHSSTGSDWFNVSTNITSVTSSVKTPQSQTVDETNTVRVAYFYCLAVILPVGIICNAVCVGIFASSRSLRRSTTAHYLAALAIADTLFLIGEMMRWSSLSVHGEPMTGRRFMHETDVACKLTYLLRYSGKVISAWLTVAITAERFITIAFPLTVNRISTQLNARITICLITVAGFGLGAFPLWTVHKGEWRGNSLCRYRDRDQYDTWNTVVLRFGCLIIPSVLIFLLTALIIIFLVRANRRRRLLTHCSSVNRKNNMNVERQLTMMLLFVAMAFLLLRLPYCVTYYLTLHKETLWPQMSSYEKYQLFLANKVADILATSNYAANFFLYCISGNIFRQQIIKLLRCHKKKVVKKASSRSLTGTSMLSFHNASTRV